jgi:ribosomal protein S18 acetylase RimI-like enzyme
MPPVVFVVADAALHRDALIELNVEYLEWVFGQVEAGFGVPVNDIAGMPVKDYVPTVIDKVCGDPPPKGVFYLVYADGALAGMGGIRFLRDTTAEIKRIYFRPAYRGNKLGERMLRRLLSDARAFGYTHMLLDSAPFMTSAHRLYEACGFADCAAYPETEVPEALHARWRFMSLSL